MNNKKFGFTLAEVLITLAIIGVVAALTLPTLLSNYQKKEWATRLIKTHAVLTQDLRLLMSKENTSSLSLTSPFHSLLLPSCSTQVSTECKYCLDISKQIFNDTDVDSTVYQIKSITGGVLIKYTYPALKFKNGVSIVNIRVYKTPQLSTYDTKGLGGNLHNEVIRLWIDVNGAKGPNEVGRDVFTMIVSDDGVIYPEGSKDSAIYSTGTTEKSWSEWHYACEDKYIGGYACTARVLETGKMDY